MASKSKKETPDTVFVTRDGRQIQTCKIDVVFVQRAIRSVKLPPPPTYEVRTVSGRKETHIMDAAVVEQSKEDHPEYEAIWRKWRLERSEAEQEQSDRGLRATFLEGTVRPDSWDDPKWERRMRLVGIDLPDDPDELWLLYLTTSLEEGEIWDLSAAIMRTTGLPEEAIREAEETFLGDVHTE